MNGLMRNRHLFRGHLRKPVMEHNTGAVLAFRAQCEKGAARFGKVPQGVAIRQEMISEVRSEWIVPEGAPEEKLIFYVHGGGYVSGSCNDHRSVVAKVAISTGITNLLYEYRVAPEHPYPAVLEDSLAVYRAVLSKGYLPENIVMMGESAGGGLCLAVLLALKEWNIPLPQAAVAISPWTDLACTGESYQTKNKVSLAPRDSWTVFSHYYTAGHDAKDPHVSPLYGDLHGLPPIFLNAGNSDELIDDSRKFFGKAKSQDVDISFREGEGMVHCYPLLAPMFREATEAMEEIIEFIRGKLNVRVS